MMKEFNEIVRGNVSDEGQRTKLILALAGMDCPQVTLKQAISSLLATEADRQAGYEPDYAS